MTSQPFPEIRLPLAGIFAYGWLVIPVLGTGCADPDKPTASTGAFTSAADSATEESAGAEAGSMTSGQDTAPTGGGSANPTASSDPTTSSNPTASDDGSTGGPVTTADTTTGEPATTTSTDDSTSGGDVTSTDDGAPAESDTGVPPTTLDPGVVSQIDGVFSQWDNPNSLGCAVAVAQDGEVAYQQGYGVANTITKELITGRTVFYLASVSKQITGGAIALAVIDGDVTVEDGVRTHLPSLPAATDSVRVRHLLYHTSGIAEYGPNLNAPKSNAEVLTFLMTKGLDSPAGNQFKYTNTNYVLLAEVVRASTGKSLRQFTQQRFFMPLGMNRTQVHDETSELPANRATGYEISGTTDTTSYLETFYAHGDGNIWSSAEDMAKWGANFGKNTVGGPEFIQMMSTDGGQDYAFGIVPGSHAGRPSLNHYGQALGFSAQGIYFLDGGGDAVVVLCNSGPTIAADSLAEQVVNIVF